jgi:hypothetical protein
MNWGLGVTIVYTVFALSTLGFVAFAMTQSPDLVAPDYYERSLAMDQRMAAEENVLALGAAFQCDPQPDGRSVVITLPDGQAASARGTVTMYRPSNSHEDRITPLVLDAQGIAHVPLAGLARGYWKLQVQWRASGRPYYYERPVTVP